MLARESAATITPSLKIKAKVVVPFAGFTIWIDFFCHPSNYNKKIKVVCSIITHPPNSNQIKQVLWDITKLKKLTSDVTGSSNEGASVNPSDNNSLLPP